MSRLSDVRDAIATELRSRLSSQTVDVFLVPNYSREELEAGPRVCVRSGGREVTAEQGPDVRDVIVEVGVVGLSPVRTGESESDYRAALVAAGDVYDGLIETVIALWSPDGVLSTCGMAGHRFVSIEQSLNFDAEKLFNEGVWLSILRLTYQDTIDD